MTRIALATCATLPALHADEASFVQALRAADYDVVPAIWNSPEIDWSCYDLVIIRNTWDYHQQADVFRAWLDYLDEQAVPLINPSALVRWNMDKHYLQALQQAGVRTLPTLFTENDTRPLARILEEAGWQQAVVKPVISASGTYTWAVSADDADTSQQQFAWLNQTLGMMVQPFAPQFQTEGEYSSVFFNGDYSHTILRRAPQDELLVQADGAVVPSQRQIAQARASLDVVQQLTGILPTYARVDAIRDGDDLVLMEVECIEPSLYFGYVDGAAERFVRAIAKAYP